MKKILGILILLLTFFLLQKAVPISADTTCMKAQGNNVLCVGYLRCPVGPVGQQDIYCCAPGADAECHNLQTPTQPECTSTNNPGAACHLESDTCTTYYGNVGELGCPQFQRCGADCSTSPNPLPSLTCLDKDDPEFHSLRPYPGSTCVTETLPLAKFCGNTLTLQDKIDVPYKPGIDNCSPLPDGKVRCSYVRTESKTIEINLENAKLPIMGNTENVPNSTSLTGDAPTLSDAEKMNGYVSWYLNGVLNRAEDGNSKNDENNYNIVNLSGPINKLLPQAMLQAQRIQTINNVSANTNHNQIAVCGNYDGPRVFSLLQLVTGLGHVTPTECYPAGNSTQKAQGDIVLRLKPTVCVGQLCTDNGWGGDLSLFNLVQGSLTAVTKQVVNLVSPILAPFVDSSLKSPWNQKVPPLPWGNDPEGVPFTELTYRKSYNEWTGKTCVMAPILNILVCFDNLLIPNKYADLFPYIPLSSTEDIKGNIVIDSVSVGGEGISNVTFSNQTPSTLFFPHLVESDQLGSILQDTYISKDQQKDQKTGPATAVAPPSSCTTVDVRSNPGDKLFATSLSGKLGYTASFTCDFDPPVCSGKPLPPNNTFCEKEYSGSCVPSSWTCRATFPNAGCRSGYKCGYNCSCNNPPPQTCSKTVSIALSTTGNIPKVDDIWSRLVAGPTAVVKRMFPKLGTQIGTLKDIPGSTSVTYTGSAQGSAELNFPHIGGISEYFLKGIQTMLRPKGYGEPISFGPITGSQNSCEGGELPDLPGATDISCKVCGYNISPLFQKIIESAAQTFNVPASVLLGTMQHEGAFNPGNDWSDENVKEWSVCGGSFPGCNKEDTNHAQFPFGFIPGYFYADENIWGAVGKVDPSRTKETVSPCNVLDGTYAMAATLSMWSTGLPTSFRFPISQDPSQTYSKFPDYCYSWNLNNGIGGAGSCGSWNANIVATSQVGYGGWCPEPGKHPIQSYFPDGSWWIDSVVNYANNYTCR